ncbi:rhodanese-like domain-containing protein [Streptococcus sanguinis]|nr:rhodanese-like domain-containing protein [Streptococcus sanguinis]
MNRRKIMQKISAKDLYDKLQAEELQLIDVRETDEFASGHVAGAQNLPLSSLPENYGQLDKQIQYHIICQKGGRSARACEFLEAKGYQVINVEGGVEAFPAKLTL